MRHFTLERRSFGVLISAAEKEAERFVGAITTALPFSSFDLRLIRGFTVNVAHELRQAFVSQLLADGEILPNMIPVMIDDPLQQVAVDAGNRFVVDDRMFL